MAWPVPVEALWNDLQSVRAELLKETDGLSQTQADWRPAEQELSVGEILHHLTLAEVGTGKLMPAALRVDSRRSVTSERMVSSASLVGAAVQ